MAYYYIIARNAPVKFLRFTVRVDQGGDNDEPHFKVSYTYQDSVFVPQVPHTSPKSDYSPSSPYFNITQIDFRPNHWLIFSVNCTQENFDAVKKAIEELQGNDCFSPYKSGFYDIFQKKNIDTIQSLLTYTLSFALELSKIVPNDFKSKGMPFSKNPFTVLHQKAKASTEAKEDDFTLGLLM